MASKHSRFLLNAFGAPRELTKRASFAAGSSQTVSPGELLELSGGNFTPLTTDKAMSGVVAIAKEEIHSQDSAGYFNVTVPRPGDVFWFDLAASGNPDYGDNLGVSDSETVAESPSNVLGNLWDHPGIPDKQGHADVGDIADRGTTIGNVSDVWITIKEGASWWNALQGDDA